MARKWAYVHVLDLEDDLDLDPDTAFMATYRHSQFSSLLLVEWDEDDRTTS